MSVRARCALLFLACLLCAVSFGQNPEPDPVTLLREVIAAEKISDSGRLCFRISYDHVGDDAGVTLEQRATERVEYLWAPGGKFRIVLIGKDGPMRTIVSDGKGIGTGEKIWDARFAFDYNPHGTDGSLDLELELLNEMWPYSSILHLHLHPMSGLNYYWTLESLKRLYTIQIANDLAPPDAAEGDTTLKLTGHRMPDMYQVLSVRREAIPYLRFCREAAGAGSNLVMTYQRGPLRLVDGVGWIPSSCSITHYGGDAPIVSELCVEQPDPAVSDSDFAVDYRKTPMIPWPYGSRMKNFWYGIVNTFKDLWEGIADGEIGD